MATTGTTAAPERPRPVADFGDVLRAELTKLRSVRATYWSLVAAVVFMIGFAVLEAIFLPGRLSAQDKATLDGVRVSLGGTHLAQVAFGALGVLVVTSEYTTGLVRATFAATPHRSQVLLAKIVVFGGCAFAVGVAACFAAFFAFQGLLSGEDSLQTSIGDPGVLRALIGGGLFLAVLGLLGMGLGAILRSSAGAISALMGLLFVPQILVQFLPESSKLAVGKYLLMQAGGQIFAQKPESGSLGPWTGFAIFTLYAVVALAVGMVLTNRRDA